MSSSGTETTNPVESSSSTGATPETPSQSKSAENSTNGSGVSVLGLGGKKEGMRPSVGPPRPTTANVAPILPPKPLQSKVKSPGSASLSPSTLSKALTPKAGSPEKNNESPKQDSPSEQPNSKQTPIPIEQPIKASPPPKSSSESLKNTLLKASDDKVENKAPKEEEKTGDAKKELDKTETSKVENEVDKDLHTEQSKKNVSEPSNVKKSGNTSPLKSSEGESEKKQSENVPAKPPPEIKNSTHRAISSVTSPNGKGEEAKTEGSSKECIKSKVEQEATSSSDNSKLEETSSKESSVSSSSPPLKLPDLKPKIAVKRKRASLISPKSKEPAAPLRESKRSRVQVIQFQSPNPELQQIIRSFKGGNNKEGGSSPKVVESGGASTTSTRSPSATVKTNTASTPVKKNSASDKYADAVFFKGEHLAVRNAEGSFYICQAIQNIFRHSKKIKIQWLSEAPEDNPDKDVYIPEYYDKTDFETILTSVEMEKLDKKRFRLTKVEETRIKNILKKSVEKEEGKLEPNDVDISEDNPDGLDISLYKDEDQLKELERKKKREERRKKQSVGKSRSRASSKKTSKKSSSNKAASNKRSNSSATGPKQKSEAVKKTNGASSRKSDSRTPKKRKKILHEEDDDDDEDFEIMPTPKKRKSEPEKELAPKEEGTPTPSAKGESEGGKALLPLRGRRKIEAPKS